MNSLLGKQSCRVRPVSQRQAVPSPFFAGIKPAKRRSLSPAAGAWKKDENKEKEKVLLDGDTLSIVALTFSAFLALFTTINNVFVAPLDNKLTMLQSSMDTKFTTLQSSMDTKFTTLQSSMDTKFMTLQSSMDTKFTTLDTKFTALDTKFTALQTSIAEASKYRSLEEKISMLEKGKGK